MQVASRREVDRYWLTVFGHSRQDGDPMFVTPHRCSDLAGYPGIYCVLRHGQVLISAPPELVEPIRGFGVTAGTATDPTWWERRLPTWQTHGPSVHAFTDEEPGVINIPGVTILPARIDDIHDLRAKVPAGEWAEAGFAGVDVAPIWRATSSDKLTLAAANLTSFNGAPTDVGVLTHPDFPGRRLAAAVASAATHHAVRHHRLARWRALSTNIASLRLAGTLGFHRDSLQLTARPPATS